MTMTGTPPPSPQGGTAQGGTLGGTVGGGTTTVPFGLHPVAAMEDKGVTYHDYTTKIGSSIYRAGCAPLLEYQGQSECKGFSHAKAPYQGEDRATRVDVHALRQRRNYRQT